MTSGKGLDPAPAPISVATAIDVKRLARVGEGGGGISGATSNGDRLVTGGKRGIKVFDLESGEQLWSGGPPWRAESFDFAPRAGLCAVVGANELRLMSLRTMETIHQRTIERPFTAVGISGDGETVATSEQRDAYGDATVKVWHMDRLLDESLRKPWRQLGHEIDSVLQVALSPDGSLLALSTSTSVELYDTVRFVQLERWGAVGANRIVFSPDGTKLAFACRYATVSVWSASRGKLIQSWVVDEGVDPRTFYGVAFSPDGHLVAAVGPKNEVLVWTLGQEEPWLRCEVAAEALRVVAFSPDGKFLAVSGLDGGAILLHLEAERAILERRVSGWLKHLSRATLRGGMGKVFYLCFDPAREVELPDECEEPHRPTKTTPELLEAWRSVTGIRRIRFEPGRDDEPRLWIWANQSIHTHLFIWDVSRGEIVEHGVVEYMSTSPLAVPTRAATFSADGRRLLSKEWMREATLWETKPLREIASYIPEGYLRCGALDATGRFGATGGCCQLEELPGWPEEEACAKGFIDLWDLSNESDTSIERLSDELPGEVFELGFSDDGEHLISLNAVENTWGEPPPRELEARVWSLPERRLICTTAAVQRDGEGPELTSHEDLWLKLILGREVTRDEVSWLCGSPAYSPKGDVVALSQGGNGRLAIVEVSTRKKLVVLEGDASMVTTTAFSPDGRHLAGGTYNGSVFIWGVPQKPVTLS